MKSAQVYVRPIWKELTSNETTHIAAKKFELFSAVMEIFKMTEKLYNRIVKKFWTIAECKFFENHVRKPLQSSQFVSSTSEKFAGRYFTSKCRDGM
jgi:hypothetical protein